MSDAAHNHPHPTREDAYFTALEEFLRTSAGYLEVDERVPALGVSRQCYGRAMSGETLI